MLLNLPLQPRVLAVLLLMPAMKASNFIMREFTEHFHFQLQHQRIRHQLLLCILDCSDTCHPHPHRDNSFQCQCLRYPGYTGKHSPSDLRCSHCFRISCCNQ